jgi:aquaporin Z
VTGQAISAAFPAGGLAIGLSLTLIHLVSIPVTNTSVNPARSTSQAIFAGGEHIGQLWLFWVAPIIGASFGAGIHRYLLGGDEDVVVPATKATTASS